MWESVWSECGEVCWSVGRGEGEGIVGVENVSGVGVVKKCGEQV